MKFQIGDIVRFNSNNPDRELTGYLAIITHINYSMPYPYAVRSIMPQCPTEHICGGIKEDWVYKI